MHLLFLTIFSGVLLVTVSLAHKEEPKPQNRIGSFLPEAETLVKDGEYPYVVGISNFCTGTIIAPQWVLTAGHCYANIEEPPIVWQQRVTNSVVYYGSPNKKFAKTVKVVSWILHPRYHEEVDTDGTNLHDIALLRLEHPVDIEPVELSTDPYQQIYERGLALGYGFYRKFKYSEIVDNSTNILRKVNLVLGVCKDPRLICSLNTDETMCPGDSGGPLMINNKQYGVAHTNKVGIDDAISIPVNYCTGKNYFVPVANYIDWIAEITKIPLQPYSPPYPQQPHPEPSPQQLYPEPYPQQSYPQQLYPQQLYPEPYPQQLYPEPYPQQSYPQQLYPEQFYPQQLYPEPYPQQSYPQQLYPEQYYPQQLYPQQLYPQQLYPQESYPQPSPQPSPQLNPSVIVIE